MTVLSIALAGCGVGVASHGLAHEAAPQSQLVSTAPTGTTEATPSAPAAPDPGPEPALLAASTSTTTSTAPLRAPETPLRVVFIGDSVANTAATGLVAYGSQFGLTIVNDGINGCGVVQGGPYRYFGAQHDELPQCQAWPDAWQADIERDNPDLAAIVVGRWELMDRMFEGRWTHIGDPAFDAYLASEVEHAIAIVTSRGAKVALFTTPYYRRGLRPDGGLYPEDDPSRVDRMNAIFRDVASRHPGTVTVVDFGGRLSPGGQLAMSIDGIRVRSDGVHLTPQAGQWLAPWLLPQLQAIG